jgi:hypothetical protein
MLQKSKIQSSSSLFRKFAHDNVGSTKFRRPEPSSDDASRAKDIFNKYSSMGITEGTDLKIDPHCLTHTQLD